MLTTCAALLTLALWPAAELQGHRTFRVREAATAHLRGLGTVAYAALDHGAAHSSPEVRARSWRLSEGLRETRIRSLAATIFPTNYPRLPWLVVNSNVGESIQPWRELAHKRFPDTKNGGPPWEDDRKATLLWVESRLREGRPVAAIVADLDHMRDEEVRYIVQGGHNCSPPLTLPKGYKP